MTRRFVAGVLLAVLLSRGGGAADPGPVEVDPSDLTKRADLIGRTVLVDDRIRFFQSHPGRGYDELLLKRTPVVFRIPPELRHDLPPRQRVARVQATLTRDGDQWYCDVTAWEFLKDDLSRLNDGVAALPPADYQGRLAWARWAERRGNAYRDDALLTRAREVEGDAIRIEADRPARDPAEHWLQLAERARRRDIPGQEAAALAHRGLRARLAGAKSAADVAALITRIESFFPNAVRRRGNEADLEAWRADYLREPASAYRSAPDSTRAAFNHFLWADATQRLLELQAAERPRDAISLSERAAAQLPERPELASRLMNEGLQAATKDLGKLRQRDVEALAKVYRDKLGQPEKAREFIREWLNDQRTRRLGRTDAEGRVALARQYETLLGDEVTAVTLLREAWSIDPDSKELADTFRRKGFRKVNGEWVAPHAAAARNDADGTDAPARNLSLQNCTPEEVRTRLGSKPSRVVRSASQGQVIEQWIYFGDNLTSYINFAYGPGQTHPTVVAYYSLRPTVPRARRP
jgi:tetratricopeptide (TPR) repeat protein